MEAKAVAKNYRFMAIMIGAMVLGALVGWFWPVVLDADGNTVSSGATVLKPLRTLKSKLKSWLACVRSSILKWARCRRGSLWTTLF